MGRLIARLAPTILSVSSDDWTKQGGAALEEFRRYFWRKKFPTNIASIPDE
jgi:hypothetical protein